MHLTWTALELAAPSADCPWRPGGASFAQAGSGRRRPRRGAVVRRHLVVGARPVARRGLGPRWRARAATTPYGRPGTSCWSRCRTAATPSCPVAPAPSTALPARGKVAGAAAVITLAGLGPDPARDRRVLRALRRPRPGRQPAPGPPRGAGAGAHGRRRPDLLRLGHAARRRDVGVPPARRTRRRSRARRSTPMLATHRLPALRRRRQQWHPARHRPARRPDRHRRPPTL